MASAIPVPNHIIIWLDQHIGLEKWNEELKSTVSGQTDPKNRAPTTLTDGDIGDFIKFRAAMEQSFYTIPDHLKPFSKMEECLKCIEDSVQKNKKIFFITSGSLGKTIAPGPIKEYKSLKTIYVFCGYYGAHVEWAQDCLDEGIDCIMYNFHTDLLERLLRDVAEYFTLEGDDELNRGIQLAYSANIYFGWAKLLLERANNSAKKKIFDRLKYVEERIEVTEKLIKQANENGDEKMSSENDDEEMSRESYR
jgi:hypothetical protein